MLQKFLKSQFTNFDNKLECLSLASLSSLVKCFQAMLVPTQVKNLSGVLLLGKLLALHANISLGWKGLPRANTRAYNENL